jgi:transaldolase/glucose-6-phosphate isomerase
MNPLQQLDACGQSPWVDHLSRAFMADGGLRKLVEQDGVKGLTSNPSIFEKAIAETDEYTDAIANFQAHADHGVKAIYEHLAIADIQAAADALRGVYDRTNRRDGYVSLECSPYLAHDTAGTVAEAMRLWAAVARPNLMVKVPATPEGVVAIRRLVGRGLNVNVTLLFSIDVYEDVVEAYLCGLEQFHDAGGDLSQVGGVASFFVSRIDRAVSARLDALGQRLQTKHLQGVAAIASAKIAYERYGVSFSSPRWRLLATLGARTQRLLWASTSPKDPSFSDTKYADALVGRNTVDTMPIATMDAFRDHGAANSGAILLDAGRARAILAELKLLGVSMPEVTAALLKEGVQGFADAFDKLLGAVARRRLEAREDSSQDIRLGAPELAAASDAEIERWRAGGRIRRLWSGDASLWSGAGEDKWMGWLHIVEQELADTGRLKAFGAQVKSNGFKDVVLLGMGGSSLGAEVLAESFGPQPGWPTLHVLDATDPAQIAALDAAIDVARTLFVVSSKSGSTLEPNIFLRYFMAQVKSALGVEKAGQSFVAITDPGSPLEGVAKGLGFAHIFKGSPSIGGRYSVLSKFGLAPSAAMGVDIQRILESTRSMQRSCGPDVPPAENPGVKLGVAVGVAATRFQRNKITIIAAEGVADLGAWLEQLLAESTGKLGRGLIPLAGEPLGAPATYGADRLFVYFELQGKPDLARRDALAAIERAGHPVVRICLKDFWSLGGEFFRWEIAVAVAGSIIGIDPFNQPDVEASKIGARAMTNSYEKTHTLPMQTPIFCEDGVAIYADSRNAAQLGRHNSLTDYLKSHLGRVNAGGPAGDYVALLAYVERNTANANALDEMRALIRDKTRAATCLGFGPRFQHSTGQAYKGGPNSGVFLQITCDDISDIDVPGHVYSFGVVKAAQAGGDLAVLVARGRRVLRVHFKDLGAGLAELHAALNAALA